MSAAPAPSPRIVIVEDDAINMEYFQAVCALHGEVLGAAADGDHAVEIARDARPTHVLMDVHLRGEADGVRAAERIRELLPEARVIFVTGATDFATLERLEAAGPFRVLHKPVAPEDIRRALCA